MNDKSENKNDLTVVDLHVPQYDDDSFYKDFKFLSPAIEVTLKRETRVAKRLSDEQLFSCQIYFLDQHTVEEIYNIKQEVEMRWQYDHSFILKIETVYQDDYWNLYIILQEMNNGLRLSQLIIKNQLDIKQITLILKQTSLLLQYMHQKNLLCLGHNLENITFDGNQIKLIDFQYCVNLKKIKKNQQIRIESQYYSPELIKNIFVFETDIWILGVLTFLLFKGVFPFDEGSQNQTFNAILNKDLYLNNDNQLSEIEKDFILKLLTKDYKKRITISQLLQHDFLILHDIRVTVFGQFPIEEVQEMYNNLCQNIQIFDGLDIEYIILYLLFYFPESVEKIHMVYQSIIIEDQGISQAKFKWFFQLISEQSQLDNIFINLCDQQGKFIEMDQFVILSQPLIKMINWEMLEDYFNVFRIDQTQYLDIALLLRFLPGQDQSKLVQDVIKKQQMKESVTYQEFIQPFKNFIK